MAMKYPTIPFFLCLDEMNLAPVEEYFAEFLSAIESRSYENGVYSTDPIIKSFDSFGNEVCRIDAAAKPRYHAAASILSNQVIAVLDTGYRLLEECGFTREAAVSATAALVRSNMENVISQDCVSSLTGPIERGDTETVAKHLACFQENHDAETEALYRLLGQRLIALAERKNPDRDYTKMRELVVES